MANQSIKHQYSNEPASSNVIRLEKKKYDLTADNQRLMSILSSYENSATFCRERFPAVEFSMVEGRECTSAYFLKMVGETANVSQLIYDHYVERRFFEGVEKEISQLQDKEKIGEFAKGIGLSSKVFSAALAKQGSVRAYSSKVAAIAVLSSSQEAHAGIFEWSSSAAQLRRILYKFLEKASQGNLSRLPASTVTSSTLTAIQKPKPPEIIAINPVISEVAPKPEKPKWEAPADIAYADASLWMQGAGCAIAAFHPHTMKAETIAFPIPSNIDQLEAQAIALAYEKFGATKLFTDSQSARNQYRIFKSLFGKRAKDSVRKQTSHQGYAFRDLLFKGGSVDWVPREKNIVADAIAVWAARNDFSGRLNIEFLVPVNIANPNVDTTQPWIKITPANPVRSSPTVENIIVELTARRDRLTTELEQVSQDLEAFTKHSEVFKRYLL